MKGSQTWLLAACAALVTGGSIYRVLLARLPAILLVGVLLLSGCTPAAGEKDDAIPNTAESPSPTPTISSTPTLAMTTDIPTFENPVLDQDFPDPDVVLHEGVYYAYATNSAQKNIQAARSSDLVHWELLPDALPDLPTWAVPSFGFAWAPEVYRPTPDGPFVMYFVARFAIENDGVQCIGAATAASPADRFTVVGEEPLICQIDGGGSIDPYAFTDEDGQHYVLWKNDGNSAGMKTWIYIQKVSPDGLSLEGEATPLITADEAWEGILIEAPTLWKNEGTYYLFYSANAYDSPRYAVGYATADSILGPYTKAPDALLKTQMEAGLAGPGGQDIVVGPRGGTWMLFHGWAGDSYRRLYLAPLSFDQGVPVVGIVDKSPLPMP